jgi:anaerobic C4-dicarboxylate transporter
VEVEASAEDQAAEVASAVSAAAVSAVVEQVVLGNVELTYLRDMNLKIRTSLAGALLVLFVGVLSFQTIHQLTVHSHDSETSHEHEDEQCQYCAIKALPYLPVEILNIAFHCNVDLPVATSVYVSPFSDSVFVEQSGRGPPQG